MNILFIGSTKGTACALHYYTAMVRMGCYVLPFDPDYWTAQSLTEKVVARWRKAPSTFRIQKVSDRIIEICRKNVFDAVFVVAENFFGHNAIEEIRKVSRHPPVFLYHSHDNNFSPGICKPKDFDETLRSYDYVFTTKSQNVSRYKDLGQSRAYFIPSAFEPTVHRPIPENQSLYRKHPFNIAFIGTYDKSRDPILEKVGWEDLNVWGDFWRNSPHYSMHSGRIHPHAVYYFEFADILSHSKCALGLLREEARDLHTQRTFEIPACGALQFAPRNQEILSFFKEDEEIVCFDSVEELKDKLVFYLKNEERRRYVARRGHERCLIGHHTYEDRISQMFQYAGLGNPQALQESIFRRTSTEKSFD